MEEIIRQIDLTQMELETVMIKMVHNLKELRLKVATKHNKELAKTKMTPDSHTAPLKRSDSQWKPMMNPPKSV